MTEITSEFVWSCIRPRPRDSHKGTFGSVLALAGQRPLSGPLRCWQQKGHCGPVPVL